MYIHIRKIMAMTETDLDRRMRQAKIDLKKE
jgi:hypothetical protein